MSYYREVYLKSEHWMTLRIERLARSKGLCAICSNFSVSNDVHHIRYGKSLYLVSAKMDLRVLCRRCHNDIHIAMGPIKPKGFFAQMNLCLGACEIVRDWRRDEDEKLAFYRSPWFQPLFTAAIHRNQAAFEFILKLMRRCRRIARAQRRHSDTSKAISLLLVQKDLGRLRVDNSEEVSFRISDEALARTHEFNDYTNYNFMP